MANPAENVTPLKNAIPAQVLVVGKIQSHRRYDSVSYTRIVMPAADAYSRPETVEVRSKSRLGEKDEEVKVTCRLGGFTRKAYQAKDKETGEIQSIIPVDITLDVIEG
jgi:hypothetical protein